jgi:hypothetical protein
MEDILTNIMNGNWKDAVRLCKNSGYDLLYILKSIREDEFTGQDDDLVLLSVMLSQGYLQTHDDYEEEY